MSTRSESDNEDIDNIENTTKEWKETEVEVKQWDQEQLESSKYINRRENKNYKCKRCKYESHKKQHLDRHVKAIHDKVKDEVCGHCGLAFSRKESLIRHKRTVHRDFEKNLKKHIKTSILRKDGPQEGNSH